ncbi:MAG: hypothetical protein RL238_507 [Actinomycetota bacterium]|jgi:uncharacterized membrane protein
MELENLFGLPAHPLLVHLPVVIIPLAGIIAIVFAFKPAWLDRFGWGLVALSGLGALGGILAAGSGEALEESSRGGEALEEHAEMGELARTLGILFFLVVLGVVLARYFARKNASTEGVWAKVGSKGAGVVMSILLVLSAAAATVTIAQAGHQGAKLVWDEKDRGGEGDEDDDGD